MENKPETVAKPETLVFGFQLLDRPGGELLAAARIVVGLLHPVVMDDLRL